MRAVLVTMFTPWRIPRIASERRQARRVWYFALVGLLVIPAVVGGTSAGRALRERGERIAPQASLMGSVARSSLSQAPPLWRIAAAAGAWLGSGVASGAIVVGLGGALLGALLRDREAGRRLGALTSPFAPVFAFATGVAFGAEVVLARGPRDWPATAVAASLALWAVASCGAVAWTAARQVARPLLSPVWCGAGFAIASIVIWRIASEAAFLPVTLLRLID